MASNLQPSFIINTSGAGDLGKQGIKINVHASNATSIYIGGIKVASTSNGRPGRLTGSRGYGGGGKTTTTQRITITVYGAIGYSAQKTITIQVPGTSKK